MITTGKLAILHISDCHFSSTKSDHGERLQRMLAASRPHLRTAETIVVAITGDVAWSGREAEYSHAIAAIADLLHMLATEYSSASRSLALVPGNHDCCFEGSATIRDSLLSSQLSGEEHKWDDSVVSQLLTIQKQYEAFSSAVDNVLAPISHRGVLAKATIRCGDKSIGILGLNTAWTSSLNESPGSLWVPVKATREALEPSGTAFNIVLAHHPTAWIHGAHRRPLMEVLNTHAHIVLQGHEHVPGAWERLNLDGEKALFLEGGVLFDKADPAQSSFNVLLVDVPDSTAHVHQYALRGDRYESTSRAPRRIEIVATATERGRVLSDSHLDYLDSPGASFSHPRKSRVTLDDIFVHPDCIDLDDNSGEDALEKTVSSSKILSNLASSRHIIVVGYERSGKTTLIKQAFRTLHRDGMTPVLLRGETLKKKDVDNIEAAIERAYLEQYRHGDIEYWRQLPKKSRAVVLDNLDSIPVNSDAHSKTLTYLAEVFGKVVCSADSTIFYGAGLSSESYAEYQRYDIQDFGHVKRDELISKWVKLGQELTIDQGELQTSRDYRASLINSLMGRNLIPARPVFILVLLQSIEAGSQDTLKGASYGNYYEFLITNALLKSGVKPDELDSIQNYLSELAHVLIDKDQSTITLEEKAAFDSGYIDKYDVRMNVGKTWDQLKRADVLTEWDGTIRFKYRYALYFFAARYLARRIGIDDQATEKVKWLVEHLYVSRNSDLLLFITHHCSHPIVLNMILDRATRLFANVEPLSIESESDWINQLVAEIPKLVMRERSTEEYRKQELQKKDLVESKRKAAPREIVHDESDGRVLDLAAEMNISFRVTATLGQILRNHYGSLEASKKLEIGGIAYKLVGRVLARYVRDIGEHRAEIISWLQELLEKDNKLTPDKAREKSANIMFAWMSWLMFAITRRSAELLGSQKLQITHEKLGSEKDSALSRMISLATELDHPSLTPGGRNVVVPIEKIAAINNSLRGNPCGQVVLRRIALDHIYKYSIDIRDKQKLCSELGISVARQEQIALFSSRKKS